MISINATLVVQLINFLLLMFILNKLLYKPILGIIEQREKAVADDRQEMKRLQAEAKEKARSVEHQMSTARKEAGDLKQSLQDEASLKAQKIIDKAQADAQAHITAMMADAEKQADEARAQLDVVKKDIVDLVFFKVMGRETS